MKNLLLLLGIETGLRLLSAWPSRVSILKRKITFIYKISVTIQIRRDACGLLCIMSLGIFTMSVCGSDSITQNPLMDFHEVLCSKFFTESW